MGKEVVNTSYETELVRKLLIKLDEEFELDIFEYNDCTQVMTYIIENYSMYEINMAVDEFNDCDRYLLNSIESFEYHCGFEEIELK